MPVPTSIADLSTTASSNSPSGSEARSSADDYLRTYASFIRALSAEATIASAGTITPSAVASVYSVTGTTTITSIASTNSWTGRQIVLVFAAALTLTYNASTLVLPGAASITTAAGDVAIMECNGTNSWRCLAYTKASGLPVISPTVTLTSIDSNWSFDGSHRLLNGGLTQPSFLAVRTSNQTSGSTIIFSTEQHDIGSNYNNSTGEFTTPVAGRYLINATVHISNTTGSTLNGELLIVSGTTGNLCSTIITQANNTTQTYNMAVIAKLLVSEAVSISTHGFSLSANALVYGSSNGLGTLGYNAFSAALYC